ncbi:hypothetical protein GE09DRAFT_1256663 [Coniochaeta sp. 2T2.1]|nr:hypothetical protein GE09DRAFT_1269900 [Coniochaeta sp. 2T2.1]KAB5581279.1 hypothetical protein GE09DRAFT_1256663 [Coniochaeta sp. 2T2.1]
MGPRKTSTTTRVPIPPNVPPEAVISALQAHIPLLSAQPYMVKFEPRAVPVEDLVHDPFFRADGLPLQGFLFQEKVPVIGSLVGIPVVVPCVFQSFAAGTRCRADARGGVTIWSSYEVRRKGEVPRGPGEKEARIGKGNGKGQDADVEWELVEVAVIECCSLVKVFIMHHFALAHQELLQRVVDDVARRIS